MTTTTKTIHAAAPTQALSGKAVTARTVEERLRLFLFSLSGAMCLGTIAELWLAGHTQQPIQFLPFVLCALGLAAVIAALLRPSRSTLWALRFVMGSAAFGSLIGMVEHITSNLEVVLEVRPNAAMLEALWEAMRGAAPLLAPGILALAAITAIAATYGHPVLEKTGLGRSIQSGGKSYEKR